MNRLVLSLSFLLIAFTGFSQRVYFIYLQTENEQPFFVRMDKEVYSSTASGYLILSKLRDSTYNLAIGFPQNKWPEQKFTLTVARKDQGFLLKNFGEKGWGLFNLQTLAVQMSTAGMPSNSKQGGELAIVTPFTENLAKAADDPSLKTIFLAASTPEKGTGTSSTVSEKKEKKDESTVKQAEKKPIEKKEPVAEQLKPATVTISSSPNATESKTSVSEPQNKEQTVAVKNDTEEKTVVKTEPKPDPALVNASVVVEKDNKRSEEIYKPSIVEKRSESTTTEGVGLVFIDKDSRSGNDTISVLIPNQKPIVTPVDNPVKEEKKFIEMLPDTVVSKESGTITKIEPPKVYHEMNNCPSLAKESDFFKLRKSMAAVQGDTKMIAEAKGYYKTKCFSTQQIRNLGALFLTDEGKYNFFVLSYYHVHDKGSYTSLQSELKDEAYAEAFKAMLRK